MLNGANHGVYNAVPPTLATGDISTLQLDQNGNLKIIIMAIVTSISQGLNITPRIVSAAGDVTLTNTDYTVVVNKPIGAATVVNLPPNTFGEAFIVKDGKGDGATHNLTLTPATGTIDGNPTYVINSNYGSVGFFGDGANWLITSKT